MTVTLTIQIFGSFMFGDVLWGIFEFIDFLSCQGFESGDVVCFQDAIKFGTFGFQEFHHDHHQAR